MVKEELSGQLRFQAANGQRVPLVVVLDAARTDRGGAGERFTSVRHAGEEAMEESRLPEAGAAPAVQTRELSVYEEVADAARVG
jgi:hypothetical protein